jgi:hypothetical protein
VNQLKAPSNASQLARCLSEFEPLQLPQLLHPLIKNRSSLLQRSLTSYGSIFSTGVFATIYGSRVLKILPWGSLSSDIEIFKLTALAFFLLLTLWYRRSDTWEWRRYAFTTAAGFSFITDWAWFMQLTHPHL